MSIKSFSEFNDNSINEGMAYKITGLSKDGMSLLRTIFKENMETISEIAKKHNMEKELENIIYQIQKANAYYWGNEDHDWGEGDEEGEE